MVKCCDINAGQLRTPVAFERKTNVADGAGGWTTSWAPIAGTPTRARVEGLSGSERLMAQRVDATTSDKLICRYVAGISAADRVLVDGEPYRITWVDNVERRNKWLEMRLSGGVAT